MSEELELMPEPLAAQSPLAGLRDELEALRGRLRALVGHVGTPGLCKGCGARIAWVRHLDTGANTPYDADGVNHFATCPQADNFRRRRRTTSATNNADAGNDAAAAAAER